MNHIMNMNDYAYATENYEIGLIAGLMLQKIAIKGSGWTKMILLFK